MAAKFVETITNRIMAADLTGAATTVQDMMTVITETGIPYHDGETRPTEGYEIIFSPQDEQWLKDLLNRIGLPNLSALLHFERFKETREKTKFVYTPIKSNIVAFKLWVMRNAANNVFVSSERVRASFEHILTHLNPEASSGIWFHLPRILVTDMVAAGLGTRFVQVLRDLNPETQRATIGAELELRGLTWEQIYQEIVAPNLRVTIQKSIDVPAPQIREPAETFDQAVTYIRHGAVHEVIHFLAGYLSKEMEQVVYKIFIAAREPNHPLFRLYRKNMPRALLAAQKYRVKNHILAPTEETTQLLLFMFISEMLCDSMSIFLMEKAGQNHIYLGYGIALPEDLKALYEMFLSEFQKRDSEYMILLFTQEDCDNSGILRAQEFMTD